MSKVITTVIQRDAGGENPKSKLFEQPLWELHLEDGEIRILGKPKMEEYLSKSSGKTVHHFIKRISILKDERKIVQWNIVFVDYDCILLSTKELCSKLFLGHQRKDEEKYKQLEEELKAKGSPLNPALFISTPRITTPQEKEEIKRLRQEIDGEEAFKLGIHLHDDEKIEGDI